MKKLKVLLLFLIIITMSGFAISCEAFNKPTDNPSGEEPTVGFIWSENEDCQREVGSTIFLNNIWARYNDSGFISPSIVIYHNNQVVDFDLQNKLLVISELGEYSVNLTFTYQEQVLEKSFTITSVDTTAPTIIKKTSARLYRGDIFDLETSFEIYDAIDKLNVQTTYKVKSPNSENVDITDNKFAISENGSYEVEIIAKDSRENTAEKTFNIFVREDDELEFFRLEDEQGQKGYSVDGRDFTITTEHATGKGGALYYQSVEKYGHSYIKLNNTLNKNWQETNGIIFNVYNPKSYSVKLKIGGMINHDDLWANNYVEREILPEQENRVLITKEELAEVTLNGERWVYIEICFENNVSKLEDITNGLYELYFDDFKYASSQDVQELYSGLWLYGTEINGNIKTDIASIKDGNGQDVSAMKISFNGSWMRFYFGISGYIDWSNTNSISFDVYNPSDSKVGFKLGTMTKAELDNVFATTKGGWGNSDTYLMNSGWNRVNLEVNNIANGSYLYFATGLSDAGYGNTTESAEKAKANGLYFANFQIEELTESLKNELKFTKMKNITGALPEKDMEVLYGENPNNIYSAHIKNLGTWISVAFNGFTVNPQEDRTKTVSFYAYNPSKNYDVIILVGKITDIDINSYCWEGYESFTLSKDSWTKITINVSEWGEESYIGISTNYDINETTSTSDKWKEIQNSGLYFDEIEIDYFTEKEFEEIRHDTAITDNF